MRSSGVYRVLVGFFGRGANAIAHRAREAQRRGDWRAAEALWAQVVRQSPNWASAWIQLGNMLNELERRDEAIAAFTRAGEIEPTLAHAPAGIAGVHERSGNWCAAEAAWDKTIARLRAADPDDDRARKERAHAFAHAAFSARHSGSPARAARILADALTVMPEMGNQTEHLLFLAELLPPGESPTTSAFLKLFLKLLPADVGDAIDPEPIEVGNLFLGLVEIAPHLSRERNNPEFLIVAGNVYERARLWREAVQLAAWHAELEPGRREHIERAFRAAAQGRQLAHARELARRYARETGELLLVHELAQLYETVDKLDRARLLTRFLRRRWSHSRWHSDHYIALTARTRSLPFADRLVRMQLTLGRHDRDLDQTYARAAFDAGHYAEARLRLESYIARHDDEEAEVLLGYAIANCAGLDEAETYFRRLAAVRMQAAGPMVGLAHIAMRKRDLPGVLDRWSRVAAVHPGMNVANVEMARVAYEMRDIEGAEAICRRHLDHFPDDIATGEFYAWLLTMNGKYELALRAIEDAQTKSGRSWETADLLILCMGKLGTLDANWHRIVASIPSADAPAAAARIYHLIRILVAAERRDLAARVLADAMTEIGSPAWAWPYLEAAISPVAAVVPDAKLRWTDATRMVRASYSDRLDAMPDSAVDSLLLSRKHGMTVHIVNKFEQPRGGSELHALDLAAQIGRYADVQLWAPETPHPEFTAKHGVRSIDPSAGSAPHGGVLVFVGIYFELARWIGYVRPSRIIFLYNTFESPTLFAQVEKAFRRTGVRPELLYCSDLMRHETGLPGRFEPSPIDLELFSPPPTLPPADRPFTLGRHSRDVVEKHGADDWRVYQAVADLGGESLVLGGSCMRRAFRAIPGLHLLPSRSTEIPSFLRGLDAYFYRTSTWVEPWGRVVIEAMACGLPVVAHAHGGYAQAIQHEKNGLLFDTTAEAERLVRRLAEEPSLRARIGLDARETVCELLSSTEMKRLVAFYLL